MYRYTFNNNNLAFELHEEGDSFRLAGMEFNNIQFSNPHRVKAVIEKVHRFMEAWPKLNREQFTTILPHVIDELRDVRVSGEKTQTIPYIDVLRVKYQEPLLEKIHRILFPVQLYVSKAPDAKHLAYKDAWYDEQAQTIRNAWAGSMDYAFGRQKGLTGVRDKYLMGIDPAYAPPTKPVDEDFQRIKMDNVTIKSPNY